MRNRPSEPVRTSFPPLNPCREKVQTRAPEIGSRLSRSRTIPVILETVEASCAAGVIAIGGTAAVPPRSGGWIFRAVCGESIGRGDSGLPRRTARKATRPARINGTVATRILAAGENALPEICHFDSSAVLRRAAANPSGSGCFVAAPSASTRVLMAKTAPAPASS